VILHKTFLNELVNLPNTECAVKRNYLQGFFHNKAKIELYQGKENHIGIVF